MEANTVNLKNLTAMHAGIAQFLAGRVGWLVRIALLVGGVVLIATQAPTSNLLELTTWAAYAVLALSLVLVWGKGNVFSFAQVAFFGLGAYAYGVVAINLGNEIGPLLGILMAAGVGAVAALVIGYLIFYGRLKPLPTAMVTLAFTLVLSTLFSSFSDSSYRIGDAVLGGYMGMAVPSMGLPGPLGSLSASELFIFVGLVAVAVALLIRLMIARPSGRKLLAVAENDERAELLGYNVRAVRLRAYGLGGAIAGLAGSLYAGTTMYIDPSVFGLAQAALVVVWVMLGGRTSLVGAFLGVFIVQGLNSQLGGAMANFGPFILGGILILVVVLLPAGLIPSLVTSWKKLPFVKDRRGQAPIQISKDPAPIHLSDVRAREVRTEALSKSFGGLKANNEVSLFFEPAKIHSVVGPNGAGKSTFFSMLVGMYTPTSGKIFVGSTEITRMPVYLRSRLGLGIKRQVSSVFQGLSVRENLWLAAYAESKSTQTANERSAEMVRWLGMQDHAENAASELSHGHRQFLEIAMVLSSKPSILLLDEPTAGMTSGETARIASLIHQVSEHCTVIVVEHDMEFIRSMLSPITVMHRGEVLVSGTIDEIRADDRVLNVYLGRDHA